MEGEARGRVRATDLPSAAVDSLRARALALMFTVGPVLALVAVPLPGASDIDTVPWAVNATLGFPVAAVLWRWGHRFPDAVLHGVLALGAVIVAVGMTFGNGGSLTVAASFFFIWISLYVFLFFDWRAATAHLVLDAVLLTTAFGASGVDGAAAVALLVIGTSTVVGAVTGATRAELARLATIDHLTGLPNRRRLHEVLEAETARSIRTGVPYSVIVLDLDSFKAVNDTDGHQAGDDLLISSAGAWKECLRPTDVLIRYGGDEFVAVLPACDPTHAEAIAHRLRGAVPAPCSLGVATWTPGQGRDSVLHRADHHLYESKRDGGARVTTDQPPCGGRPTQDL
jgi:diguanylate cyclase (GGDEF)-like protein